MAAQQAEANREQDRSHLASGHCHHAAALIVVSQQMVVVSQHWLTNQLGLTLRGGLPIVRRALGLWVQQL